MRRHITASNIVLFLLCLMYLVTYVDRVNIGTAAAPIRQEFGLSNTELGLVFSAFAYPYLIFQIIGGWVGDRLGARLTLFGCGLIWGVATILTGLSTGLTSLFLFRVLLGFGEGATFPAATRAMQDWTPTSRRGLVQGLTHSFARFGNAVTPPMVAWLMALITWRGTFVALGCISLIWVAAWVWYFRDQPHQHPAITDEELKRLPSHASRTGTQVRAEVPWKALTRRMLPIAIVYFCYGWTLWLYLNWLPSFFLNSYKLEIASSAVFASGVFFAGVVGDTLGGVLSDFIFHKTGRVRLARLSVTAAGFLGAFLSLLPILFVHNLSVIAICLSAGFFFAELVIGPMWSIPMDIAPQYSGTGAGIMNSGSALAAVASPLSAGALIDLTGNWELPFIVSMGVLLMGLLLTFTMRPDRPFDGPGASAEPLPAASGGELRRS